MDHILGKGCYWCGKEQQRTDLHLWEKHFIKYCDFIDKSSRVHNFKYDYFKVKFNKKIDFRKKVKIICPQHGVFEQSAYNHMQGSGCPKCSNRISRPEQKLNGLLIDKFGKSNVISQYKEERYPYHVDFYIKSLDLFIELNAHWTHNDHFFDGSNLEDILILELWKSKAKSDNFYKSALETWTKRDPLKLKTAIDNNLNYLVFWDNDLSDAKEWIESI